MLRRGEPEVAQSESKKIKVKRGKREENVVGFGWYCRDLFEIVVKNHNINNQLKFSCHFLPVQVIMAVSAASMQTSDLHRFIKISRLWR